MTPKIKRNSQVFLFHTFIAWKAPAAVVDDVSDLDNKLFRSSSRVSAPVFLVFGEPTERVPSLKDGLVLILSA